MAKNLIIVAKPKTKTVLFFLFDSMESLQELIQFTGRSPLAEMEKGKLQLRIKKFILNPPCYISKNPDNGNITEVLTQKEFNESYDKSGEKEFSKEFYELVLNGKKEKTEKAKK